MHTTQIIMSITQDIFLNGLRPRKPIYQVLIIGDQPQLASNLYHIDLEYVTIPYLFNITSSQLVGYNHSITSNRYQKSNSIASNSYRLNEQYRIKYFSFINQVSYRIVIFLRKECSLFSRTSIYHINGIYFTYRFHLYGDIQ